MFTFYFLLFIFDWRSFCGVFFFFLLLFYTFVRQKSMDEIPAAHSPCPPALLRSYWRINKLDLMLNHKSCDHHTPKHLRLFSFDFLFVFPSSSHPHGPFTATTLSTLRKKSIKKNVYIIYIFQSSSKMRSFLFICTQLLDVCVRISVPVCEKYMHTYEIDSKQFNYGNDTEKTTHMRIVSSESIWLWQINRATTIRRNTKNARMPSLFAS